MKQPGATTSRSRRSRQQALGGITVLDLTHHVAGPFATKLLAACGAEVIKVEAPWGDATRRWGPFPNDEPHPEKSGWFLYLNTGKKSITLNLKKEGGRRILKELLREADILIENFSPRVLPSWGLSWDVLHSLNPGLVVVSISNFGQTGPYRDYRATELTAFAVGGQMTLTGDPWREPVKNFGHQAEYQAGFQAFGAALVGLYGATLDGIGDRIDISIQEAQVSALEMAGPNAYNYGLDTYRTGNVLRATWGIYPCKDGYVGLSALQANLPALFRGMGRPDLVETYADSGALARDNDLLEALIYSWCCERTKKEILELALRDRLPFGYLPTIDELLEWPALNEKQFWVEIDHPIAGRLTYPGAPFFMSESPCRLERAPLLGEHNEHVLRRRLGYGKGDLRRLRQVGVI